MHDNVGLGLGLAIVKKILEVHNIPIDVKSAKDEGTEFSFKIPIYKGKPVLSKKAELSWFSKVPKSFSWKQSRIKRKH